ncbi:MAG: PDZ domain-containing protein [Oscillospiraceae bacterium]|nr:PDZ domain-containing protein [Oscillospiraceae bacterium]
MKKLISRAATLLLCVVVLTQSAIAARFLIPAGQVVGLELHNDQVTVAAFDDSLGADTRAAGLQVGDCITAIDGKEIHTATDVRKALNSSHGTIELTVIRNGKQLQLHLSPQITQAGPKLGVFLKQGITGVGTVTWYDPESGNFGTLGHGVNNSSGELLHMTRGSAYRASILSVKKGTSGNPGQLLGVLKEADPIGTLYKNSGRGVFGTSKIGFEGEPLPVGTADQIRTGEAFIRSVVSGDQVQEYSVEILKVYPKATTSGRNLLLRVTDPALLEATGGIVQGMSGSPIIQDGKLIGAVTHVLVNDPTTGYGIFIENMLDAAA